MRVSSRSPCVPAAQPEPPPDAILVVDDEVAIRDFLASFLRRRGFQVFTADGPAGCQDLLDSRQISLVILDAALESSDGLELLSVIKAKHPAVPVIILTSMGYDDELMEEAHRRGAAAYVSKHLVPEQLTIEIRRVLNSCSPGLH